MKAYEERQIKLIISPEELRNLADKMEKTWPTAKVGGSTFIDFVNLDSDEDGLICIHLDQEYFRKRDKQ